MKSQSLWSSTPAWRLPICKAPSPTSAWRLSIYKGALTSPCARQFIIPTRGSVCPPTSKVAISSLSGVSKETWLSLISPLEMPDDARFASRSAQRRRSFPSTSNSKFSYLPFLSSITILVTTYSIHARSYITNDARTRRHSTTKLRVHVDKTPGRSLPKHSAPPFRLPTSAPVLLQTDDFRTQTDCFETSVRSETTSYFTRFCIRS